jgi:hypothetical protein
MRTAIFLVPPTWDLRNYTQDFGKWLIGKTNNHIYLTITTLTPQSLTLDLGTAVTSY